MTQQWEGVVISVGGTSFVARLIDKTSNRSDEEVEIQLSSVAADDLSLVQPDAVFSWTIRGRVSDIRFGRLSWTNREIEMARVDAENTIETLGWRE